MRRLLNREGVAWVCEHITPDGEGPAFIHCSSIFHDVAISAPADWLTGWTDDRLGQAIGEAVRRAGLTLTG